MTCSKFKLQCAWNLDLRTLKLDLILDYDSLNLSVCLWVLDAILSTDIDTFEVEINGLHINRLLLIILSTIRYKDGRHYNKKYVPMTHESKVMLE